MRKAVSKSNRIGVKVEAPVQQASSVQPGIAIIGIGISANSFKALQDLFSFLPEETGDLAILISQQLSSIQKKILEKIQGNPLKLRLHQAVHDEKLRAATMYYPPKDKFIALKNGRIVLLPASKENIATSRVDRLFLSLAEEKNPDTIGVILSGKGNDGSIGISALKKSGGITIVQDPSTTTFSEMPYAALQTGNIDFILPPAKMVRQIHQLIGERSHKSQNILSGKTEQSPYQEQTGRDIEMELILNNTRECFVVVDKQMQIVTFNRQFNELYYKFFGRQVIKGDSILNYANPERREWLIRLYQDVFNGEKHALEFEINLPGGENLFYLNHYWPSIDNQGNIVGAFVSCIDINDKKKSEQELINSEKRFRLLVENSSDGVILLNEQGGIIDISPSGRKILGFEETEIVGLMDPGLVHSDDFQSLVDIFKKSLKEPELIIKGEFRFRLPDGEYKWIKFTFQNLLAEFSVRALVINFRDITERDVERKKRNQDITKAIFTAQEKERYELGSELHDNVNQILATAQLTLGMAKNSNPQLAGEWITQTNEYITMAVEEIRRLSHRLAPPSFEENSMFDAFRILLNNINVDNKYQISLNFDQFIETLELSSELQLNLYRILQEQLKNILKYGEATSIAIDLLLPDIKTIRMRIYDNGIGFDPDQIRRGIGLNNIRKRIEFFQGVFALNTAPGKGCELIVEIPIL